MRSVWIKSLAVFCGVLLALPPGWCCIIPALTTRAAAATKVQKPACCACCAPRPTHDKQDPAPRDPKPVKCPCDDRLGTTLDTHKSADADLGLVVAVPLVACEPLALSAADSFFVRLPSAPSTLYLTDGILLC